jgi:chromosome segregation ATPase
MRDRVSQTKSELTIAESVLREAEIQLREINTLLEEKWAERRSLDPLMKVAASAGQMDRLLQLKSRVTQIDRSIAELGRSGAQCLKRLESAKRYLDTLNVRLETLTKEAEKLNARIKRQTKSLTAPLKLSRVNIQIEAIKGK